MSDPVIASIPALLRQRARDDRDAMALLEKVYGKWISYSWEDYFDQVRASALGFDELGIKPGEAVAIVANNSAAWLFADVGIQSVGAFTVGVFATTPASELGYIIDDCKARMVIVGDQEQADKLLDAMDEGYGAAVEFIVYFDGKGVSAYDDPRLHAFGELQALGYVELDRDPNRYTELIEARKPNEVALVGYTSGTTGLPKGVMITHASMLEATKGYEAAFSMTEKDRIVAWVSVAHPAIRGPQIYTPYRNGAVVAFPEDVDNFEQALYEIAPTYIMCPPRFLELMAADIQIRMTKSSRLKKGVYRLGLNLGERAAKRKWEKGGTDLVGRAYRSVSWALVGKGILEQYGLDKMRWPLAGGAAVSADLLRFFHSLGFELRQVYGQAETSGVPFAQFDTGAVLPGRAGKKLTGIEAKISDDGELMVRGAGVFKGYLGKPDKTAEVLDQEGWFHTGDLAEFTEDGDLVLLDRESAIMELQNGTKLAPTEVENSLKFSPYISQAVLIAHGKPYPTALVQIEMGTVSEWAHREGLIYTTFRSLTELPEVHKLITDEVDAANKRLREEQRISEFRLLPKELDVDDDELTPTRKVKRRVVNEKFGEIIASMYTAVEVE
ncbi:MAG: long-chain fatty acid--CoA ligase [bacterium]|nr:long-chain fatty acid--CoA ligase [bacterium]